MGATGKPFRRLTAFLSVIAGVLLVALGQVPQAHAVPMPKPATAFKGTQCVAPVDVMRREHMNFLKHQRDETVKDGIRGAKYSLRQCIDCHAVPDPQAGGKRTVRTFCNECHQYAAVRVDCFECHTNKAETAGLSGGSLPPGHPEKSTKRALSGHDDGSSTASLSTKLERYLGKRRLDDVRQSR